MSNKKQVFLSAVILLGFLDWLTTIMGILSRGAVEINPFLSEATKTSMLFFTAIKLSASLLAGGAFYGAETISRVQTNLGHLTKNFLNGVFSLTCLLLTGAVASNLIIILKI